MLSIQAVRGLSRLRAQGIVPCVAFPLTNLFHDREFATIYPIMLTNLFKFP